MSSRGSRILSADGLQSERTALAWTRTSLAVLANGALLMMKDIHTGSDPPRMVAAGCAVVLALSTYLIGIRRQRTLARRPLPQRIAASTVGVAPSASRFRAAPMRAWRVRSFWWRRPVCTYEMDMLTMGL